jgi:hypothetical protein
VIQCETGREYRDGGFYLTIVRNVNILIDLPQHLIDRNRFITLELEYYGPYALRPAPAR